MRLPAMAAAVLVPLWLPAAVSAGTAGKAAAPKGFLTIAASVALGPIAGSPSRYPAAWSQC